MEATRGCTSAPGTYRVTMLFCAAERVAKARARTMRVVECIVRCFEYGFWLVSCLE